MKKSLLIIWSIVLLYTAYTLGSYGLESNRNKKIYEELKNSFNNEDSKHSLQTNTRMDLDTYYEGATEIFHVKGERAIMERYNKILSINQDIVGWIKVPNTRIDYPVLKTKDNDFYLHHNVNMEPSKAGSIFMDFRNMKNQNEKHTILYGHNMKDGSMFRDLINFKKQNFLNTNPIIELSTLYEEIRWEIFSVYVTSVDFNYIQTDFSSLNEYGLFLESIKDRSMFDIEVDVSIREEIITLSTCSYEFENARFVVHAKRVRE